MIYTFGTYELDTCLHELRHAGAAVAIEPMAFKVLTYLVKHRDHAVSKEELIRQLWPGQFIKDWAIVQSVVKARKAIGDNGQAQRCIKTITGYGYRWVAEVTEHQGTGDEPHAEVAVPLQSMVQARVLARAMAPRQQVEEPSLQALPLAERIHELALLQQLLAQCDSAQEQVILLVIRLGVTPTARVQNETQLVHALSHALRNCLTDFAS